MTEIIYCVYIFGWLTSPWGTCTVLPSDTYKNFPVMCYHRTSSSSSWSESGGGRHHCGKRIWMWSVLSDSPALVKTFWWRRKKLSFASLNNLLHLHLVTTTQLVTWLLISQFLVVSSPCPISIIACGPHIWSSRCCTVVHEPQARSWWLVLFFFV